MAYKTKKRQHVETGRPSKYKEKYPELLITHMGDGFSYESFAGLVNVAISTLYEWENAYPAFSEAKKVGRARGLLVWERKGIEGLWHGGGEGAQNFNATVWIFNMKNRHNWKDKIEQEVTTTAPITIAYDPKEKK